MAKIILKSPYLKPSAKPHIINFVRYISTRDGVEKPINTKRMLPATKFQNLTVEQLIKQYPDTKDFYEYEDYLRNPIRENANEYILRVAETHAELFESREKYVDYIATRPGVDCGASEKSQTFWGEERSWSGEPFALQRESDKRSVPRRADHGLFSDVGKAIVLEQVVHEVSAHAGNVWTHIISLRREDAERLGYDNVSAWQDLLRCERNTFAKNMKIHPNNFQWYAAFHNSDHHPHVHMIAYSSEPSEPWLTKNGITNIKSALAGKIFKDDLNQTYIRQTKYRDALRQDSRIIAAEIVRQINDGGYDNPIIQKLLTKLSERLKNLAGKKVYGFLPPDLKATVDRIVNELAKDNRISQLYDLWYEQKFETIRTYTDTMPDKVPLSENDDFRSIKNAVITEAMNIAFDRLTFEDTMEEEPEFDIDGEFAIEEPDIPTTEQSIANTENKYSLYRRAKIFLDSDSPEYNPQQAIPLLIRSAKQGYDMGTPFRGMAAYRLGKIFLTGDTMEQDVEYGLKWLWEAEAQSNQYAQVLLGRTYLKGELVPQDIGLAEAMFECASEQDNPDAQYTLAKMHLNGMVKNSSVFRATELLEVSAKGGNEWAQYTLGKMLMRGVLIPKNIPRAEQLLLAAVRPRPSRDGSGRLLPGNQYAAYLLGKMYLTEDGLPKNAEKAIFYLNNSAEQGNQWAQYQFGKMLLYGKEIEQDIEKGLDLLNQALCQGNIYAERFIDNYYKYHKLLRSNIKIGVALGSLRLLGHFARIIKNRIDEENRREESIGLIEKKIRQQIAIKKEAHGLRLGG